MVLLVSRPRRMWATSRHLRPFFKWWPGSQDQQGNNSNCDHRHAKVEKKLYIHILITCSSSSIDANYACLGDYVWEAIYILVLDPRVGG